MPVIMADFEKEKMSEESVENSVYEIKTIIIHMENKIKLDLCFIAH